MPSASAMPPEIVFLHTAEAHRSTFRALLAAESPQRRYADIVDAELLRDRMAEGALTPTLQARLQAHLAAAKADGAQVVLCTCSTLGGAAERLGARIGVPTLRVDRGMAEAAVAAGERILVLACIESTLAPTCALLTEVAAAAGRSVSLRSALVSKAWSDFLAGEQDRYLERIAAAIDAHDGAADAIVLAQASMADAALRCSAARSKVLSSPRLGLRRALAALT